MNHAGRSRLLLALLAAVVALPVSSFTLEPMSASLAPSGALSIGTFRLKNDGTERIAIALNVRKRSMKADGTEINEAADSSFSIYPARLVLEPSGTAAVKIQWKGESSPDKELCFRLVAEQVPVNFSATQGSGIKIMFRYIASLYVTPAAVTHKLLVESAVGTLDGQGRKGFLLTVRNAGGRHVIAVDAFFELREKEGGIETILLSGEAIGSAEGANYLPGLPRRFFIPHPEANPGKTYDASLRFTPEN